MVLLPAFSHGSATFDSDGWKTISFVDSNQTILNYKGKPVVIASPEAQKTNIEAKSFDYEEVESPPSLAVPIPSVDEIKLDLPEINLSFNPVNIKLDIPEFPALPNLEIPLVEIPSLSLGEIDFPEIDLPNLLVDNNGNPVMQIDVNAIREKLPTQKIQDIIDLDLEASDIVEAMTLQTIAKVDYQAPQISQGTSRVDIWRDHIAHQGGTPYYRNNAPEPRDKGFYYAGGSHALGSDALWTVGGQTLFIDIPYSKRFDTSVSLPTIDMTGIRDNVTTGVATLIAFFESLIEWNLLSWVRAELKDNFEDDVIEQINSAVDALAEGVEDGLNAIVGLINNKVIKTYNDALIEYADELAEILNGLDDSVDSLMESTDEVVTELLTSVNDNLLTITNAYASMTESLNTTLGGVEEALNDTLGNVQDSINDSVQAVAGSVNTIVGEQINVPDNLTLEETNRINILSDREVNYTEPLTEEELRFIAENGRQYQYLKDPFLATFVTSYGEFREITVSEPIGKRTYDNGAMVIGISEQLVYQIENDTGITLDYEMKDFADISERQQQELDSTGLISNPRLLPPDPTGGQSRGTERKEKAEKQRGGMEYSISSNHSYQFAYVAFSQNQEILTHYSNYDTFKELTAQRKRSADKPPLTDMERSELQLLRNKRQAFEDYVPQYDAKSMNGVLNNLNLTITSTFNAFSDGIESTINSVSESIQDNIGGTFSNMETGINTMGASIESAINSKIGALNEDLEKSFGFLNTNINSAVTDSIVNYYENMNMPSDLMINTVPIRNIGSESFEVYSNATSTTTLTVNWVAAGLAEREIIEDEKGFGGFVESLREKFGIGTEMDLV